MRKLLISSIFVLIFCVAIFSQTNETSRCPTIKMLGPVGVTKSNENISFSVLLSKESEKPNLNYKWTISTGEIIEGQKTPTIKVLSKDDGVIITASVEIIGLPKNCPNKFSEIGSTEAKINCRCDEEYGKISLREEYARLANTAIELLNNPETNLVVVIYLDANDKEKNIIQHIYRLKKYLLNRKLEKERLIFYIKRNDYHFTQLRILPKNVKALDCDNCWVINTNKIG